MADDVYAIQRLLYEYADRLDRGDFDGMAELFRHALFTTPGDDGIQSDPAAIAKTYREWTRRYPDNGTPHTRHVVTNPIIDIDDRAGKAASRSYVVVFQGVDDFPLQPVIAGHFNDEFERVEGKWRFSKREVASELFGDLSRHLLQPFGKASDDSERS